jgi:putative hydrolase of the HAD superfamily
LNIVFDFGGVLFNWDPDLIAKSEFSDLSSIEKVRQIFIHKDWLDFDRGDISLAEVSARSAVNSGLPHAKIFAMLSRIPTLLKPKLKTVELLNCLKSKGHHLFALSNMPESTMQYFEKFYEFLNYFDGLVISCRVHLLKPAPEIFQYLLQHYALEPKNTLFIDDFPENLQAASQFGIHTIHFISPKQCKEDLERLGCFAE